MTVTGDQPLELDEPTMEGGFATTVLDQLESIFWDPEV